MRFPVLGCEDVGQLSTAGYQLSGSKRRSAAAVPRPYPPAPQVPSLSLGMLPCSTGSLLHPQLKSLLCVHVVGASSHDLRCARLASSNVCGAPPPAARPLSQDCVTAAPVHALQQPGRSDAAFSNSSASLLCAHATTEPYTCPTSSATAGRRRFSLERIEHVPPTGCAESKTKSYLDPALLQVLLQDAYPRKGSPGLGRGLHHALRRLRQPGCGPPACATYTMPHAGAQLGVRLGEPSKWRMTSTDPGVVLGCGQRCLCGCQLAPGVPQASRRAASAPGTAPAPRCPCSRGQHAALTARLPEHQCPPRQQPGWPAGCAHGRQDNTVHQSSVPGSPMVSNIRGTSHNLSDSLKAASCRCALAQGLLQHSCQLRTSAPARLPGSPATLPPRTPSQQLVPAQQHPLCFTITASLSNIRHPVL